MPARISDEAVTEIYRLHGTGETNREIAANLGIHHRTVSEWLKKAGLTARRIMPNNRIDGDFATCVKCELKKPLTGFQYGRRGRSDEYRHSSCTSCRSESIMRRNKGQTLEWALADRVTRIQGHCRRNDIQCDLTISHVLQLFNDQNERCFYTDAPLLWSYGNGRQPNSLSFDKIIPENGYVIGNVVLCCNRVNSIKSDVSLNEMREWMPGWHERVVRFLKRVN